MSAQKELGWGVCNHLRTEEVKTEGGTTIAIQCAGCAKLLCHYGKCDGCRQIGKLTVTTRRDKRRFCDVVCEKRKMKRERKAKKESQTQKL